MTLLHKCMLTGCKGTARPLGNTIAATLGHFVFECDDTKHALAVLRRIPHRKRQRATHRGIQAVEAVLNSEEAPFALYNAFPLHVVLQYALSSVLSRQDNSLRFVLPPIQFDTYLEEKLFGTPPVPTLFIETPNMDTFCAARTRLNDRSRDFRFRWCLVPAMQPPKQKQTVNFFMASTLAAALARVPLVECLEREGQAVLPDLQWLRSLDRSRDVRIHTLPSTQNDQES